ncbi:MAG: FixH family protein [Armatimonas sp.]
MFARKLVFAALPLVVLSVLSTAPVQAQTAPPAVALQKSVGKYQITLRPPVEGIYAGEQIDIEFRVLDTSRVDPASGATGVVRAQTKATITMPEMAGMPAQYPKIHTEGVPGDYGLECFFPHGGQYQIALSITPPGESKPILATFLVDVQDAEARQGKKPAPQPFFVEVKSQGKVEAGKPVTLLFAIRNTKTKALVKDIEVAHTKLFHLMVASKDLSWFSHEHPEQQADGTFVHTLIFPTGGEFRLYADVAPQGAGSQILGTTLKVSGAVPRSVPLVPSSSLKTTVDGITAAFSAAESPIPVGRSTSLTFTLTDSSGKAITDLEPYLGAYGHLMIAHQDGQTVVHSHPAEDDAGIARSRKGIVAFNARFPKPGLYKAWGQFQRGGLVVTLPFVLKIGGGK